MPTKENVTRQQSVYLKILEQRVEPILFENVNWFVLFSKRPCKEGHLLIVPKQQVPKFHELPLDILKEGLGIATLLSKMLDRIYKPPQVALFIKGFTNDDHAHIHISPVYASEDINKDLSRPELDVNEMNQLAQKLKPEIEQALS